MLDPLLREFVYPSLDEVEFLAGSSNRVAVLDALLASHQLPHTLRELTGASRITVNRILHDLEHSGWISRENGQCELTTRGAVVANEFGRLLATMDAITALDEALSWIPVEEFDFPLAHFRDATVERTSSWKDHTEAIRHTAGTVADATDIWGVSLGFSHEVAEALRSVVVDGDATLDLVIDGPTLDMIRTDPGLRRRFHDVIASDQASMARYAGEAPLHMMMVLDETVTFCGHIDAGPPPGIVESSDGRVRRWARSYYASVREGAEPIGPEAFADEPSFTA